ncbi:MAG: cytochrome ubiquinol oxidase subunit I [Desulfobaccales bacterium]
MEAWFDHLMLSRYQFALTTMFHINWAMLSLGLSLFLVVLEALWLASGDDDYYRHARFWGRLFVLNFALGVVSGLPLEFQFGSNWGRFAVATGGFFGNILGFETTLAFMLESGFLGLMLFGWGRLPRGMHLFATCMVAVGASLSAFWIMVANSWMQTPAGGHWQEGRFICTNFLEALFNPDMFWGVSHMWVACLETTLFAVGGLSAWYLLNQRHAAFFTKSLKVALLAAVLITPAQIYLGDGSGRTVARHQPAKLGAMEAHWRTNPPGTGAPWKALAWPNPAGEGNSWTFLTIPRGLSLLVTHSFSGRVPGLRDFAPEDRPPILIPFYAFRVMIGIGFLLFFLMLWSGWQWRRGRLRPEVIVGQKLLLAAWVGAAPLGFLAVETGWLTREVGRQPWIIYGMMRTSEAASRLPAAAVWASLLGYLAVYILLLLGLLVFAARIIKRGPDFEARIPGALKTGPGGAA